MNAVSRAKELAQRYHDAKLAYRSAVGVESNKHLKELRDAALEVAIWNLVPFRRAEYQWAMSQICSSLEESKSND